MTPSLTRIATYSGMCTLISLSPSLFVFTLRYTCLIDEGETFLITGGKNGIKEDFVAVARYNINGWIEDLDDLNERRWYHACTRYTNHEGIKVRFRNMKVFKH